MTDRKPFQARSSSRTTPTRHSLRSPARDRAQRRKLFALLVTAASLVAAPAHADDVVKIRDNLFLLEEAYNQEPGVIQHIQSLQLRDGEWSYSFTEEWPVPSDRHQLSVTLPLLGDDDDSELGDVLVNYRLQVLGAGGIGRVAAAPRLSLVLPTGDEAVDAGRGALGVQTNLPVSIDLDRAWVLHLNAGVTAIPDAHNAAGDTATTVDTAVGGALVWLPLRWANALIEVAHTTTATVTGPAMTTRETSVVVNPGLRFAVDFDSGLQVVPGVSMPIELAGDGGVAVLFYLSLEHPLWRAP